MGFFLLSFSWARWQQQLCKLEPRMTPTPLRGQRARPPGSGFQDSTGRRLAGDSLQLVVAHTVLPELLPPPGTPCRLSSAPTPLSQREACRLGGGLERVGSPPDRTAVTGM